MVRCKSGRPANTTIEQDELMYYFYKIANDEVKHYSANELINVLKLDITRRYFYQKISDIHKKCEKDKTYLQHIIDIYSKYNTINEALAALGFTPQPAVPNNQAVYNAINNNIPFKIPVQFSIADRIDEINISMRDVSFNLIEIRKVLMLLKQSSTSRATFVKDLEMIINNISGIPNLIQSIDNKFIDVDNRLSILEDGIQRILDIIENSKVDLEIKSDLEVGNTLNHYENSNPIKALYFGEK